jgi:diguanylate cyclase (GGDEF)-like protein/PAS domain S-box-containing protein
MQVSSPGRGEPSCAPNFWTFSPDHRAVTPTLAERIGLRPPQLSAKDRRALAGARAAAICFVIQGALVLAASLAAGGVDMHVLPAVAASLLLAVTLICLYERLPRSANHLMALAATLVVAELTFLHESGEFYAPLYLGVAMFVSIYFNRRQAVLQILVVAALWALALARTHPPAEAAQMWILGAGTLMTVAATTRALRDRLSRAAESVKSQRALLDAFFVHAPAGFGFLDEDLRHVRVNQSLAEIMGHERDEIEGRTLGELAPMNGHILEPLARSVLESGEAVLGIEIENSEGFWHLVSYYPVPATTGLLGVATTVTDVTHMKDVERRLEETNRRLTVLATTDDLTQLPNRRLLDEKLELALARARRGGLAVAVLNIDLDRFKEVNDSLGHAYGDRVLIEMARCLREGARETDVVARVGGDEFVVLLADLDVQEAPMLVKTVVDRIRARLSSPFAIDAVELRTAACIGTAIFPIDSRDAEGLLAAADAAMYAGKSVVPRVA